MNIKDLEFGNLGLIQSIENYTQNNIKYFNMYIIKIT